MPPRSGPLPSRIAALLSLPLLIATMLPPVGASAQPLLRSDAAAHGLGDGGEANGAAFGDLDGDGWPDLFVARLPSDEPSLLYRNQQGRFELQRPETPLPWGAIGGLFTDWDADGDEDLYVIVHQGPSPFYANDGGILREQPTVTESFSATGGLFADLLGVGRPQLFTTHRRFSPNQLIDRVGGPDVVDVTRFVSGLRAGVETLSASPVDYDGDGDLDLYVTSLTTANLLHANRGSGVFRQVPGAAGLASDLPSVGALPADVDGDGDTDVFVLNSSESPDQLFRNEGGRFVDVSDAAGIRGARSTTGGVWADVDNDGDLDVLTGHLGAPTTLYRNGEGRFSADAGDIEGAPEYTAGIAAADIDLDGDVDFYLAAPRLPDVLLKNESDVGRFLRLSAPDASLAGTRVEISGASGTRQTRTWAPVSLLGSTHLGALHVGLGGDNVVDVRLTWPDGRQQQLTQVVSGTRVSLKRPPLGRDLAVVELLAPDMAFGWGDVVPAASIRNDGTVEASSRVRFTVTGPAGETAEWTAATGPIAPGASVSVAAGRWSPRQPGGHHFEATLLDDDDHPANDSRSRDLLLHAFEEASGRLGVRDAGHGWAGAFGDIDNDGDLDLYISNGGTRGDDANVLYRNETGRFDTGRFRDVTREAGVEDAGNGTSVAFADFDRDGDQDLFLSKGGFDIRGQPNRLFHNDGAGRFTDVSEAMQIDWRLSSYSVVLGDFDVDGYLDVYNTQLRGQANHLFRNRGSRFETVTAQREILSFFRYSGSGGVFSDFDNDGDTDLLAGFFGEADRLYSETGGGTYRVEIVGEPGGDNVGIAIGDIDNDGDMDPYVVNQNGRSVLYRNDLPARRFVDVATRTGTENQAIGTGVAYVDFESDGDLDLLVSNLNDGTRLYVNDGEGRFDDRATALGVADPGPSRSVMVGDVDGDGDEDIYTVNEGENTLFLNGGDGDHGYLRVRVRGVESNADGIGARIYAHLPTGSLMREINGAAGNSYSERPARFGLGTARRVDSLTIRWPNGHTEHLGPVAANRTIEWVEGGRVTAVLEAGVSPGRAWLGDAYPNPFNPDVAVEYSIPRDGVVRLEVYNGLGQRVSRLQSARRVAGAAIVRWAGTDDDGRPAASGIYYLRMWLDDDVVGTRRLALVR